MTEPILWRVRPGQQLRHWGWDEQCVLYNDLSGDTHLLDEAALLVLLTLAREPATDAALAQALDLEDQGEAGAWLAGLLDSLKAQHLVEPC